MSQVHQGPEAGQASDATKATKARACLDDFVQAARALNEAWHPDLELPTYPRYLRSFEEFLHDLEDWHEEAEDRPYSEPRAVKPVNLADRAAARAWLTELRKCFEDAAAAGLDATRPPSKRDLGRRSAQHLLLEARGAFQQLLQAAEHGLD